MANQKPIPIKIENASIEGQGGSIQNATITGDATLQAPTTPPGSDAHPEHPILLPPALPPGAEDSFWILCYCPNPPPPHWEWILFSPGSPPERPHPQPPPDIIPDPPHKDFPPEGGWGYQEPYGWIFWPGSKYPGPKRK